MEKKGLFRPKTVTCSLCGHVLNRRSTVPINPKDRICKIHPEAAALNEKFIKEQIQKKVTPEIKAEQKKDRKMNRSRKEEFVFNAPKCFCCKKEGIDVRDFYLKMAITLEKLSLIDEPTHFFDPEFHTKIKKFMTEKDLPIFTFILNVVKEQFGEETVKTLFKNLHSDLKIPLFINTIFLSNQFNICGPCIHSAGLEKLIDHPAPTIEQLHNIGAALQPTLHEMAKKELEEDKK
jgi:hypothetical protein